MMDFSIVTIVILHFKQEIFRARVNKRFRYNRDKQGLIWCNMMIKSLNHVYLGVVESVLRYVPLQFFQVGTFTFFVL